MKWPWVSRRAFDVVQEQLVEANARLKHLIEHNVRLERRQAGLKEAPTEVKEIEPMPVEGLKLIRGWDDPQVREAETIEMVKLRARTGSWDKAISAYRRERGL